MRSMFIITIATAQHSDAAAEAPRWNGESCTARVGRFVLTIQADEST
jgi:hypothetical protein